MDTAAVRQATRRLARRWSAAAYAAFFVLFALPFATLYAACSRDRVETINGYQTLAPHTYTYQAADGTTKAMTTGTDGFAWFAIALVAIGIAVSLVGLRTLWLSAVSVAGVVALFLANLAAGGGRASSKAEIGFWLSAAVIALAPAADVRPWRRAALVGAATVAVAVAVVGVLVGLIALTTQNAQR
jgi:hypothetical protein